MFNAKLSKICISVSAKRFLATETKGASSLVLNFNLPHQSIYKSKVVDKVILPGENGEYGITVGKYTQILFI